MAPPLACEVGGGVAAASQDVGSPEAFREAVRQHTKGVLLEIAGDARAPRTLDNLKHAVYKAIWWFASMGLPLPPSSEDVAQYLAFLSVTVDSIGSGTQATQAIGFLADVNRWDRSKIMTSTRFCRSRLLGGDTRTSSTRPRACPRTP